MAIIDARSVEAAEQGGPRGQAPHRRVSGRERHRPGDTLGLILAVVVPAADIRDRDGARRALARIKGGFPRLKTILADAIDDGGIAEWAPQLGGRVPEIVPKPVREEGEPFEVMKWRWIVARTIAWLGRYRRLSKGAERQPESSEAMISLAMIGLMLGRLELE